MKKSTSGFTLVELMVVAAIIAILAAIIVPLLSSNRDSAIAAEAANLCSMGATEAKIHWTKTSDWPSRADLPATTQAEMDRAKYFNVGDVAIGGTGPDDYEITVSGGANDFSTGTSETLILDEEGQYSGTMVTAGWIGN